jgi:hypothetical protein
MADIYTLIELGVAGIGCAFFISSLRGFDQTRVDRFRRTFEVTPNSLGPDPLLNFTRSLSSLPRPRFLGAISALALEHYADHTGERFFVHVGFDHQVNVDQLLLEHTGVTLEPIDPLDDIVGRKRWDKAVELSIESPGFRWLAGRKHSHLTTPLRIIDAKAVAATMGAPFKNIAEGEAVVLQWQLFPDRPRTPTAEDKAKVEDHTFHLTCRLGAIGENPDRMLRDLSAPFHSVASHGAKFVRRPMIRNVPERINRRAGTKGFWIYLNAFELMALLSWPLDGSGKHNARRIPPTIQHNHPGEDMITIGTSNSPRMQDRQVAVPAKGLLTHTWITGPTSSGKSTLLENICVDIMGAGMGLFVIEPKAIWSATSSTSYTRAGGTTWFGSTQWIGSGPLG